VLRGFLPETHMEWENVEIIQAILLNNHTMGIYFYERKSNGLFFLKEIVNTRDDRRHFYEFLFLSLTYIDDNNSERVYHSIISNLIE